MNKLSWWTIPQTREEFAVAWRERDRERLTRQNKIAATQSVKVFSIHMHQHRPPKKRSDDPPKDAA